MLIRNWKPQPARQRTARGGMKMAMMPSRRPPYACQEMCVRGETEFTYYGHACDSSPLSFHEIF